MNLLKRILMIFTPILSRIGICGNVGFISGTICGFIISNLAWAYKDFFLTDTMALKLSLLLAILAWFICLFILLIRIRFSLGSIAFPTLFNCLVVCFLTVFITK